MRYLSLFVLSLCAACQSPSTGPRGKLLIVGGGLKSDNTQVLSAFASAAGGQTLVIPTASGVPEESAPGTQSMLAAYTHGSQQVDILDIRHDTPERAQDPAYTDPIHHATAAWFTGGNQSRILAAFRPGGAESDGAASTSPDDAAPSASASNPSAADLAIATAPGDSPAYDALLQLLARDGLIAGTSAGAAMMSDPMIARGTSQAALLHGTGLPVVSGEPSARATTGMDLTQGMGFFPYGIVDQHFLARARFGRLIVAMVESGNQLGIGIADNRAILVDLAKSQATALGNQAAVLIDTSQMVEGTYELHGTYDRKHIRISLASHGDTIDFTTNEVHPAPGKAQLNYDHLAPIVGVSTYDTEPISPWDKNALAELIEHLALDPRSTHSAIGDTYEVTLRADPQTKFWSNQEDQSDLTASNVILDIIVRP